MEDDVSRAGCTEPKIQGEEPPQGSRVNKLRSQSVSHEVSSDEDLVRLLRERNQTPGFLILSCRFQEIIFHPKDPRVLKFFEVFGPTLINLELESTFISNSTLTKFFSHYGKNLVSLKMNIWDIYPGGCLRFPSLNEDGTTIILPKLGILKIYGTGIDYYPNLEEIHVACPNLVELEIDTLLDMSDITDTLSFENLKVLKLRSYKILPITGFHLKILLQMNLKSLKSLHLIGLSSINTDKRLNFFLESLGSTLEELDLQMASDQFAHYRVHHRLQTQRTHSPLQNRFGHRHRCTRNTTIYTEHDVIPFSSLSFPIRLPNLKSFVTSVDFDHESKLFKSLPKMERFICIGTLYSVSGGSFNALVHLELRECDDQLLLDIYKCFENLEELIIADGSIITDFGITGNKPNHGNDSNYLFPMPSDDRRGIKSLKKLKKFWALLSPAVTDVAVFQGFSECLLLEELCLSQSLITTASLKLMKQQLTHLKELQIRQCVNIPYLDVIKIFYKSKEGKKINVRYS